MEPAGTEAGEALDDEDDDDEPTETAVCAFVANNLKRGATGEAGSPCRRVGRRRRGRSHAAWATLR